jgi:hypothetical protein
MNALLKTDELYEWFGCKQPSKLARLLRERNISYTLNNQGKPITTLDAINASLNNKQKDDEIEF